MMTISVQNQKSFSTFFLILEHFLKIFCEHIYAPLSGLSWKTEIYRPEEIRPGPFSICLTNAIWVSHSLPRKGKTNRECYESALVYGYIMRVNAVLLSLCQTLEC